MFRKQALIGLTVLGLGIGCGAAGAMPVGLQGLPANPAVQQAGATVQPAGHFKRRHFRAKRHFVHPRKFRGKRHFAHPRVRHRRHFVHPHGYRFVHPRAVRRHHFVRKHRVRPRGHFSFSFSFGRW